MDALIALRTLAALALLAFAPGFAWSLVLMPRAAWPERVVASVGLSVAIVVLVLFAAGLLGIPLRVATVVGLVLLASAPPIALHLWWRRAPP